ncbi:MAG: lipocalin family protein, partial [Marinicella sp.]
SEYIIVYVDSDYQYTIIGRTKRDYVWIMARQPEIPQKRLEQFIQIIVEEGYDQNAIQLVPQQ